MCGRAASSRVTPQIIADTVGLPVDCAALPETSSLGAAILARALVEAGCRPRAPVGPHEAVHATRRPGGPGRGEAARVLSEYLDSLGRPMPA